METQIPTKPTFSNSHAAGVLYVILGALLFSSKGIFIKLAYRYGIDASSLLALRMLIAFPFYAVIMANTWRNIADTKKPQNPQAWSVLVGMGFLGYYLASMLDFVGLQYISAGLERMILFLYPTLVIILGIVLNKKKPSLPIIAAMFISYFGITLFFWGESQSAQPANLYTGAAFVLASAISFAFFVHYSENLNKRYGSTFFTSATMLTSVFFVLIQALIVHPTFFLGLPWQVWVYSLCLGILGTVIPSFLLNRGMVLLGSGHTALLSTTGPINTLLLSALVLGEHLTILKVLGAALVVSGGILVIKNKK